MLKQTSWFLKVSFTFLALPAIAAPVCEDLAATTCPMGKAKLEFVTNDAVLSTYEKLIAKRVRDASSQFPPFTTEQILEVMKAELGSNKKPHAVASEKLTAMPSFQKLKRQIRSAISKELTVPAHLHLLQEKVFPELKNALLEKIEGLVADPLQRKAMNAKIRKIHLDNETLCDTNQGPMLYRVTARYRGEDNSFRVCDGSLGLNFSEFKLVHSVAHEISHSIDPCNLQEVLKTGDDQYVTADQISSRDAKYPVPNLLSCLRDKSSIEAKAFPSIGPVEIPEAKKQTFDYCESDQIVEAVADWLGDELLVDYMTKNHPKLTKEEWFTGLSEIFHYNCDSDEEGGRQSKDVHPSTLARIDRLLLVNPKVRARLGCANQSPFRFCDLKSKE